MKKNKKKGNKIWEYSCEGVLYIQSALIQITLICSYSNKPNLYMILDVLMMVGSHTVDHSHTWEKCTGGASNADSITSKAELLLCCQSKLHVFTLMYV